MAVATLPIASTPTIANTGNGLDIAPLATAWSTHHARGRRLRRARRVLYFTVDRRPLAIVRAADAQDVAATVAITPATTPCPWRCAAAATASRTSA